MERFAHKKINPANISHFPHIKKNQEDVVDYAHFHYNSFCKKPQKAVTA